ncbi:hypothetical protein [Falsiroseomonas sp. E2-1-a4]|uniref:hypothetical protein n=1 Tax=Falsiroseomonas sp. E2-1-a4 TaxID=3239299 RepID=UPI003F35B612
MQSLYFLAMLLGVAWLCVWSILPASYRTRGWWPFAMRNDVSEGKEADQAEHRDEGTRRSRRGTATSTAQPPVTADQQTKSWRIRRAQAVGSRRHQ